MSANSRPVDLSRVVERVHTRLLARYGARWISLYAAVEPDLVKADWAQILMPLRMESIAYALDHLPDDYPPNAAQFRALCLAAPDRQEAPALPPPKADGKRLASELRRLSDLLKARKPLQWAEELRDREKAGDALSDNQRQAWRRALAGATGWTVMNYGEFTQVPHELLPPGMRRDYTVSKEAGYAQKA